MMFCGCGGRLAKEIFEAFALRKVAFSIIFVKLSVLFVQLNFYILKLMVVVKGSKFSKANNKL